MINLANFFKPVVASHLSLLVAIDWLNFGTSVNESSISSFRLAGGSEPSTFRAPRLIGIGLCVSTWGTVNPQPSDCDSSAVHYIK